MFIVCCSDCSYCPSDPSLSGSTWVVEQCLMAWDFLSSSRELVGFVLPPAKRMLAALVPPKGKVMTGNTAATPNGDRCRAPAAFRFRKNQKTFLCFFLALMVVAIFADELRTWVRKMIR